MREGGEWARFGRHSQWSLTLGRLCRLCDVHMPWQC
jgi:hypothetical protein